MGTASETCGAQFDDRENSTEAIYSGSDEDYDLGDNEKLQAGTGERRNGRTV